jgi:dipeptidyl-peptidase-4
VTDRISFPRQYARTQRFTLGAPRTLTVGASGERVVFLRSASGTDPVTALWVYDVAAGAERLVADPRQLFAVDGEQLPPEERARRERMRESAGGITAYAIDRDATVAAFALSGRLFLADLAHGDTRELPVETPVFDPRPAPDASRIAFVHDRGLWVVDPADPGRYAGDRALVREGDPSVAWGVAEFLAAEEMGRHRGYWWAPDAAQLLVARIDESAVQRWHVADPADPAREPVTLAYPAAGTANADVSLALIDLAGAQVPVGWDRDAFPYLVDVRWPRDRPPLLLVQSRDQRRMRVLRVDVTTGATSLVRAAEDPVWLEIVPGAPAELPDGRLVEVADVDDVRRLLVDGDPVSPERWQVREVVDVSAAGVVFTASEEPTEVHVWRWSATGALERLTDEPGVHGAAAGGDVVVVSSASMDWFGTRTRVRGSELASYAETPVLTPSVALLRGGQRDLRIALLLPTGFAPGGAPLPVLLDPYGGPHAQRVLAARNGYLPSQWFADQGFAVLVADGRGTPGRGPAWEKAVAGDLATAALADQVAALAAVAAAHPGLLDLSRVAIRGWSFGGYLAALAVLRRPDVFAAAVAGAPVVDWRLYDTHYTERYLGVDPAGADGSAYDRSSLLADATGLARPLLLIHGLADDNVVAAHTLRLSAALLAAGRPHNVLPLSGVTHMTPQEEVAENLLLLQVDFLNRALGTG